MLSLPGLNRYYHTPKQPHRQSVQWLVDQQGDDDTIVAISLARWGLRFYGPRIGLREHEDFVVVDTRDQFVAVRRDRGDRHLWVVTTLPRWSRVDAPDLLDAVERDFQTVKVFDATVGDGHVRIWRSPTSPPVIDPQADRRYLTRVIRSLREPATARRPGAAAHLTR